MEVSLFPHDHRLKLTCPVHGWLVTLPEGPHELITLARVACTAWLRRGYDAVKAQQEATA